MASNRRRTKTSKSKTSRKRRRLSLGLDASTQSFSYVLVDIDSGKRVLEKSLDYLKDKRLRGFGLNENYIVPPRVAGEADQVPEMFLAALEAVFSDLQGRGVEMSNIVVINTSGQQHGHVYLSKAAKGLFARLKKGYQGGEDETLVKLLRGSFAYQTAPIWRTSNTVEQADFMRRSVGGKKAMIELSGSDAPLRFTGVVVRRVGEQFPSAYEETATIQLISSLIPAVLTGNTQVPIDFGNGCGTLLMDYRSKKWSKELLSAASSGLPGGDDALRLKLPRLVAPDTIVGPVARYFADKFGLGDCLVVAGSGDNPQSKTLVLSDLLSLGTSFVFMVGTDGKTFDLGGQANAMYDGVGRPFMFGCRTNGTLVWNAVRKKHKLKKKEYAPAERALRGTPMGRQLVFWQPENESFPPSGAFGPVRIDSAAKKTLGYDYGGVIDSSLAAVYLHSAGFSKPTGEPLYITGGGANSRQVRKRVAAIWNRNVVWIQGAGAALGAAVAGAKAYCQKQREAFDVEQFSAEVLQAKQTIEPDSEDVSAFHAPDGYLERFKSAEAKLIKKHPSG